MTPTILVSISALILAVVASALLAPAGRSAEYIPGARQRPIRSVPFAIPQGCVSLR
jgi:hypothetical protein